MVTMVWAVGRN